MLLAGAFSASDSCVWVPQVTFHCLGPSHVWVWHSFSYVHIRGGWMSQSYRIYSCVGVASTGLLVWAWQGFSLGHLGLPAKHADVESLAVNGDVAIMSLRKHVKMLSLIRVWHLSIKRGCGTYLSKEGVVLLSKGSGSGTYTRPIRMLINATPIMQDSNTGRGTSPRSNSLPNTCNTNTGCGTSPRSNSLPNTCKILIQDVALLQFTQHMQL